MLLGTRVGMLIGRGRDTYRDACRMGGDTYRDAHEDARRKGIRIPKGMRIAMPIRGKGWGTKMPIRISMGKGKDASRNARTGAYAKGACL